MILFLSTSMKFTVLRYTAMFVAVFLLTTGTGNAEKPATAIVNCAQPTLSAEKFTDIFHDIVMHGNLRDVPFIESTLYAKLKIERRLLGGIGSKSGLYRTLYHTNSILGYPVRTWLDTGDNDIKNKIKTDWATLKFEFNISKNCLSLSALQLLKCLPSKSENNTIHYSATESEEFLRFKVNDVIMFSHIEFSNADKHVISATIGEQVLRY